jgi:hypothetical protein
MSEVISEAGLERLAMFGAWLSQLMRLIKTITKQLDAFKGANFEAGVKGLPALGGSSALSKKGEKINLRRLRFFYQLHLAAASAALYSEKGRRRAPQRH